MKKTKIEIEVETKVSENLMPEEDGTQGDMSDQELKDFREEFAEKLNARVVSELKRYVNDLLEENFIDNLEEESVEGWESFDDYGIKVTVLGDETPKPAEAPDEDDENAAEMDEHAKKNESEDDEIDTRSGTDVEPEVQAEMNKLEDATEDVPAETETPEEPKQEGEAPRI